MNTEDIENSGAALTTGTEVSSGEKTVDAANDQEIPSVREPVADIRIKNVQKVENRGTSKNQVTSMVTYLFAYERPTLDVTELKKSGNQTKIPPLDRDTLEKFLETNFLVIRYDNQELGMVTMENLVFGTDLVHDNEPLCCTLEGNSSKSVNDIIRLFIEHEKYKPKALQVLVVYDNSASLTHSGFLRVIMDKGGPAHAATSRLKQKGIMIIYLCAAEQLPDHILPTPPYFALYTTSSLQPFLYQQGMDAENSLRLSLKIRKTISTTGWLSQLTEAQREKELERLIREGRLEAELQKANESVDETAERKKFTELSADPLTNIVLFTAVFFGHLNLKEFNLLIDILVGELPPLTTAQDTDARIAHIQARWETEGDMLIDTCGLIVQSGESSRFANFGFEKGISRQVCRDLLWRRFRLALVKRMEVLKKRCLLKPAQLSSGLIEGIIDLCFINAETDQEQALYRTCVDLSAAITNLIDNDDYTGAKKLFERLILFIIKWDKEPEYRGYLSSYYQHQLSSARNRSVMGGILAQLATIEQPDQLKKLKLFLDSIGHGEVEASFITVRTIIGTYMGSLSELIREFNKWAADESENTLPKSYSYAWYSLLRVFFEHWDEEHSKKQLDFMLFDQLIRGETLGQLEEVAGFIFSTHGQSGFDAVMKATEAGKPDQKELQKGLQLRYGLVLTQWYAMLHFMAEKNAQSDCNPDDLIRLVLQIATRLQGHAVVEASLRFSRQQFNALITNIEVQNPDQKKWRELLIRKRNHATYLMQLVEI